MAESTIGLYKTECIHREGPWRSAADVELATCSWVGWFNTSRLHSGIGYLTPMEYEHAYHQQNNREMDRQNDSHEHQPAG